MTNEQKYREALEEIVNASSRSELALGIALRALEPDFEPEAGKLYAFASVENGIINFEEEALTRLGTTKYRET